MTKKRANETESAGKLLVERHGDFLREVLKHALTRVMSAEVEERCGAALPSATTRGARLSQFGDAWATGIVDHGSTTHTRSVVSPSLHASAPPFPWYHAVSHRHE